MQSNPQEELGHEGHPPPDLTVGWMVHDIVVGGAAGLAAGFVAGLFALRVVDRVAVPFIIGAVFAVVGAIVLARHGRGRVRMTFWRIVAWAVFALGTGFLLLLYRAIDGLQ